MEGTNIEKNDVFRSFITKFGTGKPKIIKLAGFYLHMYIIDQYIKKLNVLFYRMGYWNIQWKTLLGKHLWTI